MWYCPPIDRCIIDVLRVFLFSIVIFFASRKWRASFEIGTVERIVSAIVSQWAAKNIFQPGLECFAMSIRKVLGRGRYMGHELFTERLLLA